MATSAAVLDGQPQLPPRDRPGRRRAAPHRSARGVHRLERSGSRRSFTGTWTRHSRTRQGIRQRRRRAPRPPRGLGFGHRRLDDADDHHPRGARSAAAELNPRRTQPVSRDRDVRASPSSIVLPLPSGRGSGRTPSVQPFVLHRVQRVTTNAPSGTSGTRSGHSVNVHAPHRRKVEPSAAGDAPDLESSLELPSRSPAAPKDPGMDEETRGTAHPVRAVDREAVRSPNAVRSTRGRADRRPGVRTRAPDSPCSPSADRRPALAESAVSAPTRSTRSVPRRRGSSGPITGQQTRGPPPRRPPPRHPDCVSRRAPWCGPTSSSTWPPR